MLANGVAYLVAGKLLIKPYLALRRSKLLPAAALLANREISNSFDGTVLEKSFPALVENLFGNKRRISTPQLKSAYCRKGNSRLMFCSAGSSCLWQIPKIRVARGILFTRGEFPCFDLSTSWHFLIPSALIISPLSLPLSSWSEF